jgi:hypothetical protein
MHPVQHHQVLADSTDSLYIVEVLDGMAWSDREMNKPLLQDLVNSVGLDTFVEAVELYQLEELNQLSESSASSLHIVEVSDPMAWSDREINRLLLRDLVDFVGLDTLIEAIDGELYQLEELNQVPQSNGASSTPVFEQPPNKLPLVPAHPTKPLGCITVDNPIESQQGVALSDSNITRVDPDARRFEPEDPFIQYLEQTLAQQCPCPPARSRFFPTDSIEKIVTTAPSSTVSL